jgi:hypothetical protein
LIGSRASRIFRDGSTSWARAACKHRLDKETGKSKSQFGFMAIPRVPLDKGYVNETTELKPMGVKANLPYVPSRDTKPSRRAT